MKNIYKKIFVLKIISGFFMLDAMANDLQNTTSPWSGHYVGVYFGGGSGKFSSNYNQVSNFKSFSPANIFLSSTLSSISGNLNGRVNGAIADIFIGYNHHQLDSKLLVGGQLEGSVYSDITMKSSNLLTQNTVISYYPSPSLVATKVGMSSSSVRYDLSSMLSVIGRAGVLARPNVLVYGLLGLTEGHFVVPDQAELVTTSKGQWKLGLNTGAGIEHKFNEYWSIRGEYRYMLFNITSQGTTQTIAYPNVTSTGSTTTMTLSSIKYSSNVSNNIGKIGIVFKC